MTQTDSSRFLDPEAQQPRVPTHRKAVFFCPECGHTNPVDGDWIAQMGPSEEQLHLVCPQCETVILTRTAVELSDSNDKESRDYSSDPGSMAIAIWLHGVATSWRLWATWIDSGPRPSEVVT